MVFELHVGVHDSATPQGRGSGHVAPPRISCFDSTCPPAAGTVFTVCHMRVGSSPASPSRRLRSSPESVDAPETTGIPRALAYLKQMLAR